MATTTRSMRCAPTDVFTVLADGWLFPAWVVGASRMRDVEEQWPHVGSHLHHSFGTWPFLLNDDTTSLQWNPPHRFVVEPEGWPLGRARVTLEVEETARGCRVRMTEHAVKGLGTLVPGPIMHLLILVRNREALRRLRYLAEGGAGRATAAVAPATPDDRLPLASKRGVRRVRTFVSGFAVSVLVYAIGRGRARD